MGHGRLDDPDEETGKRSDTIMVIHVEPEAERSMVLSFPRDLWVNIPGIGNQKINAAFNSDLGGGPDTVIAALKNKQIDGIVVDFPSTGYITAVQVPSATVVGRLPPGGEYFGLVFEEGNPLRDCVNQAIAALQEDGSIAQFQEDWINTAAPPVLE